MFNDELEFLEISCHENIAWKVVAELLENEYVQFVGNSIIQDSYDKNFEICQQLDKITSQIKRIEADSLQFRMKNSQQNQNIQQNNLEITEIIHRIQQFIDEYQNSRNEYTRIYDFYKLNCEKRDLIKYCLSTLDERQDTASTDIAYQSTTSVYLESLIPGNFANDIICGKIDNSKISKLYNSIKRITSNDFTFQSVPDKINKYSLFVARIPESKRLQIQKLSEELSKVTLSFTDFESISESLRLIEIDISKSEAAVYNAKTKLKNSIKSFYDDYYQYLNQITKISRVSKIILSSEYDLETKHYTIKCWSKKDNFMQIQRLLEQINDTNEIIHIDVTPQTKVHNRDIPSSSKSLLTDFISKFNSTNISYYDPIICGLCGIMTADAGYGVVFLVFLSLLQFIYKTRKIFFVYPFCSIFCGVLFNQFFGIHLDLPYYIGYASGYFDITVRLKIMTIFIVLQNILLFVSKLAKLNMRISSWIDYLGLVLHTIIVAAIPSYLVIKIFAQKHHIIENIWNLMIFRSKSKVFIGIYYSLIPIHLLINNRKKYFKTMIKKINFLIMNIFAIFISYLFVLFSFLMYGMSQTMNSIFITGPLNIKNHNLSAISLSFSFLFYSLLTSLFIFVIVTVSFFHASLLMYVQFYLHTNNSSSTEFDPSTF